MTSMSAFHNVQSQISSLLKSHEILQVDHSFNNYKLTFTSWQVPNSVNKVRRSCRYCSKRFFCIVLSERWKFSSILNPSGAILATCCSFLRSKMYQENFDKRMWRFPQDTFICLKVLDFSFYSKYRVVTISKGRRSKRSIRVYFKL